VTFDVKILYEIVKYQIVLLLVFCIYHLDVVEG
jgi:hypothetical protein